jgi:uncharacterized membrane protein (UPF0127 family)
MHRPRTMILAIVGILLIAVAILGGVFWYARIARGCNPPLPRKTVTIGSATVSAELATTMGEQACGLSGREGLSENDGMLFPFSSGSTQSFWMKDMQFPIDIIWISDNTVVGFVENADPQIGASLWKLKIYNSPPKVNTVLEVPAGFVQRKNIHVGDTLNGV